MLESMLTEMDTEGRSALVHVNKSDISKVIGQRGENRNYLIKRFLLKEFRVVSDGTAVKNHPIVSIL